MKEMKNLKRVAQEELEKLETVGAVVEYLRSKGVE